MASMLDVVEAMLEADPSRLEGDDGGKFTPLRSAAFYGYPRIVRYLLDRGASVHGINPHGHTALSLAVERCWTEIASMIREAGGKMPDEDPIGPVVPSESG